MLSDVTNDTKTVSSWLIRCSSFCRESLTRLTSDTSRTRSARSSVAAQPTAFCSPCQGQRCRLQGHHTVTRTNFRIFTDTVTAWCYSQAAGTDPVCADLARQQRQGQIPGLVLSQHDGARPSDEGEVLLHRQRLAGVGGG